MASTIKGIVASLPLLLSDSIALRLGCEVSRIANSGIGVINVEAADGFRSVFDDVVVTAPLGRLKRSENFSSPPLTPRVLTAIRSLGYRNLDRVFIKFPEAFWNIQASKTNTYRRHLIEDIQSPAFSIESFSSS